MTPEATLCCGSEAIKVLTLRVGKPLLAGIAQTLDNLDLLISQIKLTG